MSGWRARIGLISPVGESIERAFNLYAPEGVAINSTKLWFPGPSVEGLIYLSDQLEQAAKLYATQWHDVVIFGCTSGSFIKGVGFDQECIKRIETVSGAKGLTTSTAILQAFERLGMPTTAVITPYPDETNEVEKKFLEDNGITVTNIAGIEDSPVRKTPNICTTRRRRGLPDLEASSVYRAVKEMDLKGAQSLFISCTGLNVMEIIPLLETDLGIPVITSNQASLWGSLRLAGVGEKNAQLGKLFTL